MFIFNPDKGKEFSRTNALGLQRLVISDDVNLADKVSIGFNADTKDMIVWKDTSENADVDELGEKIHLLVDEIGIFNNIDNKLSVVLTDDSMLLDLEIGAILIKNPMNGEPMLVHRGIEENKIKGVSLDKVYWIDKEKILSFVQFYNKYGKLHSLDYINTIVITSKSQDGIKFKFLESMDISCGGFEILDKKEEQRQLEWQMRQIQKMHEQNINSTSKDDEYEEEGDYDKEDEDDYDDYDEYDEYD